ncbi:MAG TPA: hypothetical protein VL171_14370 [Verrucomicrobiae bacterium]|nr:hypothetical protein [Verrucomicrobiae bacterium]
MSKHEEIAVRTWNEELDVTALMAIAQCPDLEVLAMRSYCDRDGVVLLLVTNNPFKTTRLLERIGYHCHRKPVLLVGPLARRGWTPSLRAELEGSGIHVVYSYAHRTERGQHYIALKTEEDERALRVLEVSSTLQGAKHGLTRNRAGLPEELRQAAA